ncbi:TraB/GumN family protein [Chitinophaga sp. Mgbs1]|uniref:TraB/GumN family protein n=1 Tax=Chitinophaga solisilvae TaxID=1233460 RepID=A0A9Q5GR25_9BACT|nr:TraB/GumN family protein [Chitinophaga solisilvae]
MHACSKTISLLFAAVFLYTIASAQQSSLLWKVSGKGLSSPSYLFGTIHMICKDDLHLTPAVTTALQATNTLCLEIDITDPETPRKMKELLLMPEDYSFKSLFDSTSFTELEDYFTNVLHINIEKVDRAKPMLVTSILLRKALPCDQPVSPETELADIAQSQQKKIAALETREQQVQLFDSIPDKTEAAMILSMVRDLKNNGREFHDLVQAYRSQDLDKIYQLTTTAPDLKDYQHLLLFNRNQAWIPKITSMSAQGPVFYAVGAAHLAGAQGLIALLKKQGFVVEPLR